MKMLPHTKRITVQSINIYRCVVNTFHLQFPQKKEIPRYESKKRKAYGTEDSQIIYDKGRVTQKEDVMPNVTKLERLIDRCHYDRWDLSIAGVKHFFERRSKRNEIRDQMYKHNRVEVLGPDLSAATFFIHRGASVKFVGKNSMYTFRERNLVPNSHDPSFLVEAFDLAGLEFHYEALEHFKDLEHLRCLSFKGSSLFNNWYLDRLCKVAPRLEYLDISFCKNVDADALHCLYRMRNLKCLNVEGISDSVKFRLTCLTVESEIPNLAILGIIAKPKAKSAFDVE